MTVAITVRYTKQEQQAGLQSYGLLVEAISATGMPNKIFVIRRGVRSATDTELDDPAELDEFQFIASPLELQQYPESAPDISHEMPYYRVAAVRFAFRSYIELEETLELIKADIAKLVKSIKLEHSIASVEEVTYD